MRHFVFVGHDASRTGAPILLLHLLRWLKSEGVCSFSIVLLRGGELEEDFRLLGPVYIWHDPTVSATFWQRCWLKVKQKAGIHFQQEMLSRHKQDIIDKLKLQQPKIIYGNTVVSAEVVAQLKAEFNCAAVCHVHELRIAIERYFGTEKFGRQLPHIDLLIVASEAVHINLLKTFNLDNIKVFKVYEFVPSGEEIGHQLSPEIIRTSLGIPAGSKVVAASGTLDWRKSPDLFVQMAGHLRQIAVDMPYFLWIGGDTATMAHQELLYDAEQLGIASYFRFVGSKPNPLDYLRLADVFVLTSREDPYPLVCLEAATLGKPIVCFEQAGGMPEFVEKDCGTVVPFLRPDLLAIAVQELLMNPAKRQLAGHNALLKVRSRHSVESAGRQIAEQINLLG